ncbi:MAG: M61 family metallopeptidase [Flavobacteriales bacterium]
MKTFLLTVSFISLSFVMQATEISYELRMPRPQNHYFQVEMKVKGVKQKTALVKLPVWAPGSYMVREFSRHINTVKAFALSGGELKVIKTAKNAWEVMLDGCDGFTVKYDVYAFETGVRTSFLDETHGFVSGPSLFMYLDGKKELGGNLTIHLPTAFKKVSTGLTRIESTDSKASIQRFSFDSYDQLVDCPIEIGNQIEFEFTAAGVVHLVCMYGVGNYNPDQLKKDMARLIEEETKVVGINPNKRYVFIVHNGVGGDGGLEHANSAVLSVDRWTYDGPNYLNFLNLVAHEYFHLWNVKRIRPIALGPFNYDQEVYTRLLWVMEGFTSYYDELLMRRAGFYTQDEMLKKIQSAINYVEGSVGARVQPVAHASFDAWIKAYRPNENSANTTMTYYSRGMVLAAVFDAWIIKHSNGKAGLDDVMRTLYNTFYLAKGRGFTDEEFKAVLEQYTGSDLTDFFAKYIDGTEVIPYANYFLPLGIDVSDVGTVKPVFGANVVEEDGHVIVKNIRANSAAEDAGLSVNDEVLACMDYRVDKELLEAMVNGAAIGDQFEMLIARAGILMSLNVKITGQRKSSFIFTNRHTDESLPLYNVWLR